MRLRHDRELGQLCQQDRIGAVGLQPHGRRVDRGGVDDLVELAELRALELRIGDALDREDHVLGGQRRAVMELDVAAQRELDRGVVDLLPRRRDLRDDLPLVVARHHVVEHVAIDEVAVGIPLHVRIERRRLLHQIDHQHVLRGLRRAGKQHCGQRRDTQPCRPPPHFKPPSLFDRAALPPCLPGSPDRSFVLAGAACGGASMLDVVSAASTITRCSRSISCSMLAAASSPRPVASAAISAADRAAIRRRGCASARCDGSRARSRPIAARTRRSAARCRQR